MVTSSDSSRAGCASYTEFPSITRSDSVSVRYSGSPGLLADPRVDKRIEERRRATVQNWRLGAAHLDYQIVKLECGYRRQHVLHRVDRCFAASQLSAPLRRRHFADTRRNDRLVGKIHAREHHSGARASGPERKLTVAPEVQPECQPPLSAPKSFGGSTAYPSRPAFARCVSSSRKA